jgi:hypothetical protein
VKTRLEEVLGFRPARIVSGGKQLGDLRTVPDHATLHPLQALRGGERDAVGGIDEVEALKQTTTSATG